GARRGRRAELPQDALADVDLAAADRLLERRNRRLHAGRARARGGRVSRLLHHRRGSAGEGGDAAARGGAGARGAGLGPGRARDPALGPRSRRAAPGEPVRASGASAPGKAVLIGEYAVLEGAPAVAMALDRRARVGLASGNGPGHAVRSLNSGARARFGPMPGGGLAWQDGDAQAFALVEHVWQAVRPEPRGSLVLTLDTRAFYDPVTGAKLGFGSSAALAVALAAALAGEAAPEPVREAARRAHMAFQGGRGSGVDIATAAHGGVVGYRRESAQVEHLPWPAGLEVCLLWSGRAADTPAAIDRLARARAEAAPALASLVAAAGALFRFARDCRLDVFGAGREALYDEASRRGLVYKPCGAGAGDTGAAFARDRGALDAFAAWAAQRGFARVAASLEARGVTL